MKRPGGEVETRSADGCGRAQACLFGFCLALFLLTYNTRLGSIDAVIMYETAAALWEHGTFAIPNRRATPGKDGRYYSKYGPLPSLLAVPLYGVGRLAARALAPRVPERHLTRAAVALLNPVLTAWTAALLFGVALRLGLSPPRAAAAALLYAFGTVAWYYSKTFFSEPLTALLLVASFGRAIAFRGCGESRHLWMSGAFAGLAVATRPVSLIGVPVLAYSALGRRPWDWGATARFGAPVAAVGALLAAYNAARFGSMLDAGYHGEHFSTPPWVGLAGLLASPRCGLLFYSPLLLAAPWGYRALARRRPHEARATGWLCVVWVLAMSCWSCWWGGGSWGPRLLVPVFPFLSVLTAAAVPEGVRRRSALWVVLGAVAAANVGLQAVSVAVTNARWEYGVDLLAQAEGGNAQWNPRYMPLRWQARYALEVLHPGRRYLVSAATVPLGAEEEAPEDDDPSTARQRVENRLDGHVVDAWYTLFALLGIPWRLLVMGVVALLLAAGVCLLGLVDALHAAIR